MTSIRCSQRLLAVDDRNSDPIQCRSPQLKDPYIRHSEHGCNLTRVQAMLMEESENLLLALGKLGDRLRERIARWDLPGGFCGVHEAHGEPQRAPVKLERRRTIA